MFKFVVLCAFVASAVAEPKPGLLLASPWVQPYAAYSTVVSPGSTSVSSQSSSVIHPSPFAYSTPVAFAHSIKKRSAQVLVPSYSPYSYLSNYPSVPLVASSPSIVQSPVTYSSFQLPLASHFIKKRSAPLLTTSWTNTPTAYLANPAISTPLISSPLYQTPYYSGPLFNTHFIKKRSAEPQAFLPTYYGPSNYVNTIATTPYLSSPLVPNFYSTPAVIPLATNHVIKKRSAEASPEPAAAPAADPQLAFAAYPTTTYFGGASFIPSYPSYSTVIKSSPVVATNPFIYSSFLKK